MITAATVERDFLTPALDARAENLAELRVAAQLALHIRDEHPARQLLVELVTHAKRQGELECQVAGAADQLVSDCRNWERFRRTPDGPGWSARKIGRVLRDPLADLCNPAVEGKARQQAQALVFAVLDQAPTAMLLSPAVRHELRDRKFQMLEHLHAEHVSARKPILEAAA